ncbi:MAG: sodium:solute symporter family protein [Candidatus Thermoplasmatota archaeon]|nr:sodium:solute symporter family protein [Candidatus Thermoplasmatota archaeon]
MQNEITISLLIIYLAGLVTVGVISSKKIKDKEGFFIAGRSLGILPLTATITATVVGGSATIATAKLVYLNGLPALWLDIGSALGLIILSLTLAKMVRKTRLFSLAEIVGHLFNQKVRNVAAVLIILTQIAWISLLIQGTSVILTVLLPIDYTYVLISITIIFIFYTLLGGQFAVVYTDIIQFIVMIVGICILAAPLLFIKSAPFVGNISTNHLSFPINQNLGFLPVLSFFFMMLMPNIVGPDIYSKLLSAKDEKTARYATFLSGILRIIFAISIALIALSAIILVPGLSQAEAAFALPKAILTLGPVLSGIILAAFVSVMLSSADSVLISAGTILSVDIFKKKNIKISRIGIICFGLIALVLAFYFNDIVQTLQLAYTVFTAGLTLPIIFGFYKQKTKVTSSGALLSLILGGSISLIWFFMKNPYGIDAVIIGLIISILPLILLRKSQNERANTT